MLTNFTLYLILGLIELAIYLFAIGHLSTKSKRLPTKSNIIILILGLLLISILYTNFNVLKSIISIILGLDAFFLLDLYSKSKVYFELSGFILLIVIIYSTVTYANYIPLMISISSLYMLEIIYLNGNKSIHSVKKVEIDRDILEIILSFIVISLIILFYKNNHYYSLVAFLIMAGYLFNGYAVGKTNLITKRLHKLERSGSLYGFGALTLAFGSMLILSSVKSMPYLIYFFLILMISDSLATILGSFFGRSKLFYNKKKSYIGSSTFFLSSLIGFFLIGYIAIPLSIILTLVESLPLKVDDNISLSLASVILYMILFTII